MRVISQVIATLTVAMAFKAGRVRRQDFETIDLSENLVNTKCTLNGTAGLCVSHTYCNPITREIEMGGIIHPSELRQKKQCSTAGLEWCCTFENLNLPPKLNVPSLGNDEKCLATKDDENSWFVALLKSPNDNQSEKRLFCSGALVTSRVVLTAGTCLKSAQNQMLYVQVPASISLQNYTVQYRQLHPDYNSGTHVNDFGILVLDQDVDWGKDKNKRVCLDFATQSQGDCYTIGFAEGAIIATTLLNVMTGDCRPKTDRTGGKKS